MKIVFAFSDEVGEYKKNMSKKAMKQNVFYIRGSLLIDAIEYKELVPIARTIKGSCGFGANEEIKYSDIWNWEHGRKGGKKRAEKGREYIENCLSHLKSVDSVKYIFTVTFLDKKHYFGDEIKLLKMHLRDLIQRIHMELRPEKEGADLGYASIFLDMLNRKHCEKLRTAYHQLSLGEEVDYITQYSTIKDSITFEDSRHSIGVQMADLATGVFHGCLLDREFSCDCYSEYIHEKLRARRDDEVFGYGVMEVPSDRLYRDRLRSFLQDVGAIF